MSSTGLSAEDLERLARRHIDFENERDLDKIMSTVADGDGLHYHMTSTGEVFTDVAGVRGFYHRFAEALPDVRVTVNGVIADAPRRKVSVEFHFYGSLRKPLWGLAPCSRPLSVNGVVLYEFTPEGKVLRETTYIDKSDVLSSMGLIRDTRTELGRTLLILFQSPLYTLKCAWYKLFGPKL